MINFCRVGILVGVIRIDAIDVIFPHNQNVGVHLQRSQSGRGICREVWIAHSRGEDNHATLFQMPYRPTPNVRLGHG